MMNKDLRLMTITTACALLLLLASTGCAQKKTKGEEGNANAAVSGELGNSDAGNAMGMESIQFEYDSNILSSKAKKVLIKDARILKNNPNVAIQVEGHCDPRGGIQYNLALGQRRADSVQHFLEDQGISESRVTTISYGKEKPLVVGESDDAYTKDRRANLAITRK